MVRVSDDGHVEPLDLPAALLGWRRSAGDRGVQLHADDRVTLRRGSVPAGTAQQARYDDAQAATRAVEPVIAWRPVPRPEGFGAPRYVLRKRKRRSA